MIVVVGAGLPGLAAAARLAKVGHEVVVCEQRDRVGPYAVATEPGGTVFTLPAAWRDLFRKSGRILDAELARHRLTLSAAPPRRPRFADGTELELPDDRGGQWAALSARFGEPAAAAWRDLLDGLDDGWQLVRQLGVEAEFSHDAQFLAVRRALRAKRSLADLAAEAPAPQLAELVLDVAARLGQDPRRYPAWQGFRLGLERTFGRWHLLDTDGEPQPAARLADLLVDRLATRKVDLRLGSPVHSVRQDRDGVRVQTEAGTLHAQAVISTVDPLTHADLSGHRLDHRIARRLPPAPGGGPRWQSWRTMLELPKLQSALPGVVVASAWSPAGPDSWAQLLTGALAAYRVHENLTGEDIRPTNKDRTA